MVAPVLLKSASNAPMIEVNSPEVIKLIRGWKWFAYVPEEGIQWLAERVRLREIAAGKAVYTHGDPATHIYGVISGIFRIYTSSPRGDEITLEEVVAGGWFTYVLNIEPLTYRGNCVCQQSARMATLPLPVMTEFAQRWPGYYRGLYEELADRAVVTIGRIELLSLHNLNTRLAVYLLRMAKLRGRPEPDGSMWVAADENQSEVGARVGGTRQRVNTVLKSWQKRGLVEAHKDGVRIFDVRRLSAEVEKTGFDLDQYLAGWHGGWQGRR